MECHLVVFARAPRLGRVKRRLARDIGAVAAWRFYRQELRSLLRRLSGGPWTCWLALSPDGASGEPGRPAVWRVMPQGRGGLGQRMARPMRRLPPGPVVIVGSDIPALSARHVAEAFRRLGAAEAVFGPAADGGYWLVGLRRRPRLQLPFDDVRWSTPHALTDTLANLRPGTTVAMLEVLEDVDDAAGWRRWRHLRAMSPSPPSKPA